MSDVSEMWAAGPAPQGPAPASSWQEAAQVGERIMHAIRQAYWGRQEVIWLCVTALVAGGHLLIEDLPGVGKTLLAKALARSVNCRFSRIQFTPDLLPSDITGVNVFNQRTGEFEFRPGPIFANIILADEINRASPKTQSSLLECMQERQVTIDNVSYPLAAPFMVIATQNPIEYEGTYPLPEAQLDRFMMRLSLGYPPPENEDRLLAEADVTDLVSRVPTVATDADLLAMGQAARAARVEPAIRQYVLNIAQATRTTADLFLGASPRAGIALISAARALAILKGRDYVVPQDIKDLAIPVLAHRVMPSAETRIRGRTAEEILADILSSVPAPRG